MPPHELAMALTYDHPNCTGFIIFLAIIWVLQETTTVRILRYVILFIGNATIHTYDCFDIFL